VKYKQYATPMINPQPLPDWGAFHVPQSSFRWVEYYFNIRKLTSVLIDCFDSALSHHINTFPDSGYADDAACM